MKWFHIKMLQLCMVLAQGALTVFCDPVEDLETRERLARQPAQFVRLEYMQITPGKEQAYLETERKWAPIHEAFMRDGLIFSWGCAKARPNEVGVEYISWMSFHSLSALENLYDEANLLNYMEEEALESLHQETHACRTIVGQELLISEAFTLHDPFISDPGKRPYFVLGFMDPKPGKENAYRRMEIDIFRPAFERWAQQEPNFWGWALRKAVVQSGQVPPGAYRTQNVYFDSLAKWDLDKWESFMQAEFKEHAPIVAEYRTERRVVFDVLFAADMAMQKERQEWAKLKGSWRAEREKGGYRIKTIENYRETLMEYDAQGNLLKSTSSPMRIECRHGLNYFLTFHEQGTWTSIYQVKEDTWYEQMPWIFNDQVKEGPPDEFLVYRRIK